ADTSFQSITPKKTMEIQKRIVFAVELEFTLSSLILQPAGKKTASCLFLPPLDAFPKRPICSGGKLPQVAPRPVCCRTSVANPYLVRCGAEAKVITLQGYPSLPGLIQQH